MENNKANNSDKRITMEEALDKIEFPDENYKVVMRSRQLFVNIAHNYIAVIAPNGDEMVQFYGLSIDKDGFIGEVSMGGGEDRLFVDIYTMDDKKHLKIMKDIKDDSIGDERVLLEGKGSEIFANMKVLSAASAVLNNRNLAYSSGLSIGENQNSNSIAATLDYVVTGIKPSDQDSTFWVAAPGSDRLLISSEDMSEIKKIILSEQTMTSPAWTRNVVDVIFGRINYSSNSFNWDGDGNFVNDEGTIIEGKHADSVLNARASVVKVIGETDGATYGMPHNIDYAIDGIKYPQEVNIDSNKTVDDFKGISTKNHLSFPVEEQSEKDLGELPSSSLSSIPPRSSERGGSGIS